jgi:polyhydroxyalkanoate synthesis regulator phasin
MKLTRASISLYMGLVFASGAAVGVFGDRYYEASSQQQRNRGKGRRPPSPEEFRKAYLDGMKKQLVLSDEQVSKLGNIMDETRVLMDNMHKRQRPEQEEIQRAQQEKIRAVFDELQRSKYDDMMKRMSERNKKNSNKNRGGGGF